MKKFKRLIISKFCLFTVCAAVLPLSACLNKKSLDDILPAKYGESEGLYLYSGAAKMRTDGSEREDILKSVVIDGETSEDFSVNNGDYAYSSETNKIFFVVKAEDKEYLYLYDYKAGEGKTLSEAAELKFSKSESYVYVTSESEEKGWLYSRADGTLLCDGIYGELVGDFLCSQTLEYDYDKREWNDVFSWYYGGAKSVKGIEQRLRLDRMHRSESFVYFLNYGHAPYTVNLEDGTLSELTFDGKVPNSVINPELSYYAPDLRYCDVKECDSGLYTVTVHYEGEERLYDLYKLSGGKAEKEYEFGDRRYGFETFSVKGDLYFEIGHSRGKRTYRYNPKTKKISRASVPSTTTDRTQELSVGGYEFYVKPEVYYEYQFPGYLPLPIPVAKYCYFLYREKCGKKDVMACSTEKRIFFDDIREF